MHSQKKANTIWIQFAYKLTTVPSPTKYKRQIFKEIILITMGNTIGDRKNY